MKQFKKLALVSAVSAVAALGASNAAAIGIGQMGDAVLIPYVYCSDVANDRTNTMIGLTTRLNGRAATGRPVPGATNPASTNRLWWKFYDENSVKQVDDFISVTDNDYVMIDWCNVISDKNPAFVGTKGYMLIADEAVFAGNEGQTGAYRLGGHAYMIRGNWASQAFLPVLPTLAADIEVANPQTYGGIGFGADSQPRINHFRSTAVENPLTGSNVQGLFLDGPTGGFRQITMRYFLDPALAQRNEMVFWFNRNATGSQNQHDRRTVSYATYRSDQTFRVSGSVNLSKELNIISLSTQCAGGADANLVGGTCHQHQDIDAIGNPVTVTNTGLVIFHIPTDNLNTREEAVANNRFHSGVAFNLLYMGGANNSQVQTELAIQGPYVTGAL